MKMMLMRVTSQSSMSDDHGYHDDNDNDDDDNDDDNDDDHNDDDNDDVGKEKTVA